MSGSFSSIPNFVIAVSSPVSHEAVVLSLPSPGLAIVRLVGMGDAGCSGCRIAAVCQRPSDMELSVAVPADVHPAAGSRVLIEAAAALGRRAVALTLLLPTVVLVGVSVLAVLAGLTETEAVAAGLLTLAATFMLLYRLRRRLDATAKWNITKICPD